MSDIHPIEHYRETVYPALKSKVEELIILGYERVTPEEVWDCLLQRKWKKQSEKKLHEIVNDVLTLSPGEYLHYLSMKMMTEESLFAELDIATT